MFVNRVGCGSQENSARGPTNLLIRSPKRRTGRERASAFAFSQTTCPRLSVSLALYSFLGGLFLIGWFPSRCFLCVPWPIHTSLPALARDSLWTEQINEPFFRGQRCVSRKVVCACVHSWTMSRSPDRIGVLCPLTVLVAPIPFCDGRYCCAWHFFGPLARGGGLEYETCDIW